MNSMRRQLRKIFPKMRLHNFEGVVSRYADNGKPSRPRRGGQSGDGVGEIHELTGEVRRYNLKKNYLFFFRAKRLGLSGASSISFLHSLNDKFDGSFPLGIFTFFFPPFMYAPNHPFTISI